jgi:hypothetical protein
MNRDDHNKQRNQLDGPVLSYLRGIASIPAPAGPTRYAL